MFQPRLLDGSGRNIGRDVKRLEIAARATELLRQEVSVAQPQLWDIDSPNLYFAQTEVRSEEQLLDSKGTRFGIRSLRNDAKTGFFLNGRNVKIKGVNLHHDAGLVGAAVPHRGLEAPLGSFERSGSERNTDWSQTRLQRIY